MRGVCSDVWLCVCAVAGISFIRGGGRKMSKHSEAYKAVETIANYCIGRLCDECIFCREYCEKNRSCCYLVHRMFSPGELLNSDEIEHFKERIAELEKGSENE